MWNPSAESRNLPVLYGDLYILPVPALLGDDVSSSTAAGPGLDRSGGAAGRHACSAAVPSGRPVADSLLVADAGRRFSRSRRTDVDRHGRPRVRGRTCPETAAAAFFQARATSRESGALSSATVRFPVNASAITQCVQNIPRLGMRFCGEEERNHFFNHLWTVSCFPKHHSQSRDTITGESWLIICTTK